MLNRLSNKAMVKVVAIVGVMLAILLLSSTLWAQDSSIIYPENGMDPVATFNATDDDGDAIVWSLAETGDYKRFTIDGGVLSFKSPPNYEKPNSVVTGGTLEEKNVYNVTVQATGGTHTVEVTVTNVDEDGSVSLDKPQPQATRGLEATLNEQDDGVTDEVWQWSKSMDGVTWADIEGATAQQRNPATADVGYYLRASVTYTDEFGSGKTASGVTANRVEARTLANTQPSFADQDDRFDDPTTDAVENDGIQVNRDVDENTPAGVNIGKPVSASDADSDVLIYTLGGDDVAMFSINSATGQIKTKTALDSDDDNNDETDETHSVMVTATDPSGAPRSQPVTITVNDINEAPDFDDDAPALLRVVENGVAILIGETGTDGVVAATYNVTDEDSDDTQFTYAVEGADRKVLEFAAGGALEFVTGHMVNYEKKSSYSITIVGNSTATDDADRRLTSRLNVTINVVDAEDPGTVTLSQREPQIGRTVIASLTDPDGGVTVSEWEWATADPDGDGDCETVFSSGTLIVGASSAAYTPKQTERDSCLIARATYTDNIVTDADDDDADDGEMAEKSTDAAVQPSDPANTAPLFGDQDLNTIGDQSDETSRSIAENTDAGTSIGGAVSAGDDDDDLLIYSLGGADAASFSIDKDSGQLSTKAKLDYETKNMYMVVVNATDPSGAMDSILATINVTDENDPADISGSSSLSYPEGGMDPAATFNATDQDGDAIVWSLAEKDDYKRFTIDGGVLSFKSPPNYEKPNSVVTGGTLEEKNVYNVTVQATGGTHTVEVTVTNVDEDGSVGLDKPQPQAGRGLEATLNEQDDGVTDEVWQWSKSMDGVTWADIEGATAQQRNPATADVGYYLRASVTYTDEFGSGKTASGVTANRVEARTLANTQPSFADQDDRFDDPTTDAVENDGIQVNRDVDENTPAGVNIGKPVSASDADSDVLIYTLGGDDVAMFSINSATGQIKTKTALDSDDDNNDETDETHSVMVTATDPSGAPRSQPVTITVNDINEAPDFDDDAPALLRVVENGVAILIGETGTDGVVAATYNVTDEDSDDTQFTYAVEGADRKVLEFAAGGALEFVTGHMVNYEKKSSYSITIVGNSTATDDADRRLTSRLNVTINVVDAEDPGTVTLSQREPQIGRTVIASLTDPDGGVTVSEWEWATADPDGDGDCETVFSSGTLIVGASSAAYTPKQTERDSCLIARATYTDNIVTDADDDDADDGEMAEKSTDAAVQPSDPANTAPLFGDQDLNTIGDQSDETSRSIAENTDAGTSIGGAVSAGDDDDDLLIYSLGGADAASFSIDKDSGQLSTKAKLDYETKNMYMVVVTATDPSGAQDSILVTINVTDEDDGATISLNSAPAFDADTAERSVEENAAAGDAVGDPVMATDANANDTLTYTLGGDDAGSFTIDGTGQIMVGEGTTLDFESGTTEYTVMVTATDPAGASDSVTVTISVTDMNEAPAFDADMAEIMVAENTAAGEALGDPIAAVDMDADDTLTYTLGGDDAESFAIDGETGQLMTMAALDYETTNSYTVMVTATDSGEASDSITVSITVTDMNEAPAFDADMAERSVAENTAAGEALGDPIAATDVDADDTLTYTLSGDDAESFAIDGETGQLTTMAALDYETKNSYTVMVTATDSGEASDSIMVTITVTDVNEAPVVMGDAEVSYVEGGMDAVGTYTVEPAEATLSLGGDDAGAFTLTDGVLSFNEAPDYEMAGDADGDNVYMVTITGTMDDQMGEQAIAITVTNKDEMGSISFDSEEPRAGTAIIASLMDYDGVVDGSVTWQWSIESEPGTYEDIEGATDASYTPVAGDEEKHVRVTAMYDDGEGMGKMAVATVINLVSAEVDYDADGNGTISRDEAVTAVQDYFANVITREQVLGVIMEYFAGLGE